MKPRNAFVRSHGLSPFTLPSLVSSFSFWYAIVVLPGLGFLSLSLPLPLSFPPLLLLSLLLTFFQTTVCNLPTPWLSFSRSWNVTTKTWTDFLQISKGRINARADKIRHRRTLMLESWTTGSYESNSEGMRIRLILITFSCGIFPLEYFRVWKNIGQFVGLCDISLNVNDQCFTTWWNNRGSFHFFSFFLAVAATTSPGSCCGTAT